MYNNTDDRHLVPFFPWESSLAQMIFPLFIPSILLTLPLTDNYIPSIHRQQAQPTSNQASDVNDFCPYPHRISLLGGSIWLPRSNETQH